MYAYIIRRVLIGIMVAFGVVTLVFFSLHVAPGDPISMLIPPEAGGGVGTEIADQIRAKYGLDDPLHVQYFLYLQRLVHLDFGRSINTRRPVASALIARYPATLELTFCSLVVAILIALPVGVVSAVRQNSMLDNSTRVLALMGVSLPSFWLGLLLMLLFSLKLGWLPASGRGGVLWTWNGLKHMIMPAFTLGTAVSGILMRLTRSSMLEVLGEDYLDTARAKGLSERIVIYGHALRNALIPVITVLGLQFGGLLGGAVVIETIFAWPGVGRYAIQGITGKDFPVVQGSVLAISVGFIVINLVVDVIYSMIDPRITYD